MIYASLDRHQSLRAKEGSFIMGKVICHMLPYFDNVHILKDNGLIPYYLAQGYHVEPWIATYNRVEKMTYNQKYLKGMLKFLTLGHSGTVPPSAQQVIRDGQLFLHAYAEKIDILYLFGLDIYNFIWINTYKKYNQHGRVYLKVDGSRHNVRMKFTHQEKAVLASVDLISIESKEIWEKMKMFWPVPVAYIPNGFFSVHPMDKLTAWQEKENVILTVGRLGTRQKATEVLLQAFALAVNHIPHNWNLKLVGPVPAELEEYLQAFFTRFSTLRNRIIVTGNVSERADLEDIYDNAKIFCLSSRWEGFPLVFPDALRAGCYIISTNVASAYDITCDGRFGSMIPIDDMAGLAFSIVNAVNNELQIGQQMMERHEYAKRHFAWHKICQDIFESLYGSEVKAHHYGAVVHDVSR